MLLLCDFVWVQFYNNPQCEIGSAGFNASVKQWSEALAKSAILPRLFLGAPAWPQAGSTAYSKIGTPQGIEAVVIGVSQMELNNFGGVMFWDGPEGMLNVEDGKSIIAWAKAGLTA
jgi:chitinase